MITRRSPVLSGFCVKKGSESQGFDIRKEKAERHFILSFKGPNQFLAVHPLSSQQPGCPLSEIKD